MEDEDIKKLWSDSGSEAASAGTTLHADIENYYLGKHVENSSKEYGQFIQFAKQCALTPLRSEWRVYNAKHKIVGTIDMVFSHEDGTVSIYDWKRCKKLDKFESWGKRAKHAKLVKVPDTNFWHYALQLNIYQYILETEYGLKVADRVLVCFHPTRDVFEMASVPDLQEEIMSVFSGDHIP